MSLNLEDLDSSDEVIEQASEVIDQIEHAWINEKFSPEILPHSIHAVECLLEQIQHVEENLPRLSRDCIQRSLHQLEIDRLRYLICSFLRKRLDKIEIYYELIISEESRRVKENYNTYLTESELKFAKDFKALNDLCFKESFKAIFGSSLIRPNQENQIILPNLNKFVFVLAKEDIDGVKVHDQFIDFKAGSIKLLPYHSIAHFLKLNKVELL